MMDYLGGHFRLRQGFANFPQSPAGSRASCAGWVSVLAGAFGMGIGSSIFLVNAMSDLASKCSDAKLNTPQLPHLLADATDKVTGPAGVLDRGIDRNPAYGGQD
jgi:hypothetical protein